MCQLFIESKIHILSFDSWAPSQVPSTRTRVFSFTLRRRRGGNPQPSTLGSIGVSTSTDLLRVAVACTDIDVACSRYRRHQMGVSINGEPTREIEGLPSELLSNVPLFGFSWAPRVLLLQLKCSAINHSRWK